MHAIMLAIGRGRARIFRNHVAQGWSGRLVSNVAGRVVLENARPFAAGLCKGSADLVGWHSYEIKPEDVGKRIGVFVSIEVKAQRGLPTLEQSQFLDAVRDAGGLGVIAHSVDEVQDAINKFRPSS